MTNANQESTVKPRKDFSELSPEQREQKLKEREIYRKLKPRKQAYYKEYYKLHREKFLKRSRQQYAEKLAKKAEQESKV